MNYSKIFNPQTLQKLNKKSAENLKTMLGDKSLTQTILSSQELLSQIAKAEEPYKAKLEKLAVDIVKELYPIIDEEGIVLDAKLTDISGVGSELDEIKINDPTPSIQDINKAIKQQQKSDPREIENALKKLGYDGKSNINKFIESLPFEKQLELWVDLQGELNEVKVNNPRITPEKVWDYILKLPMYDLNDNHNFKKFIEIINFHKIGVPTDEYIKNLPQDKLILFYNDLRKKFGNIESNKSILDELNEIKINNPNLRIWDFTKYLPNFSINYLKKDDIVKYKDPTSNRIFEFIVINYKYGVAKLSLPELDDTLEFTQDDFDRWNRKLKNGIDEIRINKPKIFHPGEKVLNGKTILIISKDPEKYYTEEYADPSYLVDNPKTGERFYINQDWIKKIPKLSESITPESRRRIINAVTQGAALRGAFAFYLFKEHLDELDPSLVEKYNQIMKNSFGIYDDPNAIAMMLSLLAQGHKTAGGSSKVILKEIKVNKPFQPNEDFLKALRIDVDWFKRNYLGDITNDEEEAINSLIKILRHLYPYKNMAVSDDQLKSFIIRNDLLNEIKINNPNKFDFPIHVKNKKEWDILSKRLDKAGYKWRGHGDINNFNPYIEKRDPLKSIYINHAYDDSGRDRAIGWANGFDENKINEVEQSDITIKARAICFPMLVHELIKGLYELISLQGFKGDKATNQAIVNKVDKLENEPSDIKYGKFIYDALNELFAKSKYNDPRIREFFFAEIYKLEDDDFISLVENAINENLTSEEKKWVEDTLRDIDRDLKADEFDKTGIDEIRVNNPNDISIKKLIDYVNEIGASNFDENKCFYNIIHKLGYYEFEEGGIYEWLESLHQKTLNSIYREVKNCYEKNIKEIKVNNPNIISPYQVKSQEDWERIIPILKAKGYKWASGHELEDINVLDYGLSYPYYIEIYPDNHFSNHKLIGFNNNIDFPSKNQIFEYSEKTITTTIERWKKENPKVDDNLAKQVIQRFDQIKGGLAQKLNIVSLSDELKKGNNYLNIDKYSFNDMVKLIKSLPENPDKIKKDAIQNFVSREEIDKALAQSYVARFMSKRDALKQGYENGLEDEGFTKEEVKKYIPRFLQANNAFLDPRNWKWYDFEQMLDALFPTQKTVGDEDTNEASTDADRVYNKDGIEVYKGDDVHKCISYNPTLGSKRKKYGWCVTQPGNTNYDYYRFQDRAPTFYIVFDRNKTSEPEHSPFKDQWHAFVVQVNADGNSYVVTGADNRGDNEAKTWDGIAKIVPAETWSKIKGLKDIFKPIKLSAVERGRKFASGKSLSLEEFKDLDQDEKILYIQGKASKNQLSPEVKKILPEYKINLEGRSTTLANVAIDSGQKFSWDELKNNESLAKRYAIFRFRHTNYSKDPLPLPFVKYLDEPGKEKYLKIFDENLNFNLIEKFFGEKAASDYANEEASKLQYIPENAIKYLKDDKLKKLYTIYLKLTESWNFSDNFKLNEKNIGNLTDMPVQDVTPVPINQEQWDKLSSTERKYVIDLATKVNKKSEYSTLLYALPYIVKDGDKSYVLLPKGNKDFNYDKWVLVDTNGKTIKDNISGDSNLGSNLLITGYPSDSESINRIYSIGDLKGTKLKEIKINNPIITPEEVYEFIKNTRIYDLDPQGYSSVLEEYGFWIFVSKEKSNTPKIIRFLKSLNQKELRSFKNDIEKLFSLNEIKINKPSKPEFPIEIEEKDYTKTMQWLNSLGFTWVNGGDLEIENPFEYIHHNLGREDINTISIDFADDVDEEYKELVWKADY